MAIHLLTMTFVGFLYQSLLLIMVTEAQKKEQSTFTMAPSPSQRLLKINTPQNVISNTYSVAFPLKGIYICASSSPPLPVRITPNAH